MKTLTSRKSVGDLTHEAAIVQKLVHIPGVGHAIGVREAKAHLSALLEEASQGRVIVITSAGKPKARLVAADWRMGAKPFSGTDEHLKSMPPWRGGKSSEEIIREDRDGRD